MFASNVVPFENPLHDAGRCTNHVRNCLDRNEIDFEQPHFRDRLRERDITMRQVLLTLRKGEIIGVPKKDVHGDVRIKMKRFVAGRTIQVVVALNVRKCRVVTVI
ncbi:MAG: DUF4258 domain-containing protein [Albidovulum sp.]|nr:DUF4258 domain-containing protein [Albidovulum sp.]